MATAGFTNPVHVVAHGRDAIDYLAGQGEFADRAKHPMPHLLLLDLKMPLADGFEVLQWLKAQPALRPPKIVVFTSSSLGVDVEKAYCLGADAYYVKPLSMAERVRIVEELLTHFLQDSPANVLPPSALRPAGFGSENHHARPGQ